MTRLQFGTDAPAFSRLEVQANQLRPGDRLPSGGTVVEPGVMPDAQNRPGIVRVPTAAGGLRPFIGLYRAEQPLNIERPNLTIPGLET